jgi:hypothetical protein
MARTTNEAVRVRRSGAALSFGPYQINNLFHLRRDHVTAAQHRAARMRAFEVWAEVTGSKVAA